ncbi:MAG: DUF4019 domain-containing protein [Proteobacteria bacterium]|nr:DUF4019 domain-containing protein [Pseudomonadota bacterium]
MNKGVSILLILCLFLAASFCASAGSSKEEAAVKEATRWVGLIDQGKYAEGWKQASSLIKGAVGEKQFAQSLSAARKPFGKMISRTLKGASYQTALPGVPDGEYVVIQFETRFKNKKSAIETITPKREKDGKWRVSGYYIK